MELLRVLTSNREKQMAVHGPNAVIRFRPVADAATYRFRVRPGNTPFAKDEPFEDLPPRPVEEDGYVRYPLSMFNQFPEDFEGKLDIHVTALDQAKNESPPLEIDEVDFDFVAPDAPTDGAVES
jgi:hypothetical protein